MDDTKIKIMSAAIKAVRQYGLEGVRIQNISELAGISPGALYRYFNGKEQLMMECFTYIDRQAAAVFEHLKLDPQAMLTDPVGAVRSLWVPYFRFWLARPDETVFYHRFRDSAFFPEYDRTRSVTYFDSFVEIVRIFRRVFPSLVKMNQDLLWLHVLTSTVMYAKYSGGDTPKQSGDRGDRISTPDHRAERLSEAGKIKKRKKALLKGVFFLLHSK